MSAAIDECGAVSLVDRPKDSERYLIVIVRSYNAQAIPLVAGFDWAYDLTPLRLSPIGAEGVGYVTHPYANKRPQPWEPKWEEDFGFAAAKYPVVATEFGGFGPPGGRGGNAGVGAANGAAPYGPSIIKYLEGKGRSEEHTSEL